jgi:uncharacterized SAM-binding protein YcdF (DUF218 family)
MTVGKPRFLIKDVSAAHLVEGAALAVAVWYILLSLQLLPGFTADARGLLLFGLLGLLAGAGSLRQWVVGLLVVEAAIIVVVILSPLANDAAADWVRHDPLPDSAVPAVVVLSGAVNPDSTVNAPAVDNLMTGLELTRSGKARVLVTTTVHQRFPFGTISSEYDQSRIISLVAGNAPWLRTAATTSTRQEALAAARLLFPRRIRLIALVASPLHTRRACLAFEAVGFTVVCVPARSHVNGGRDPGGWPADRLKVFGDWVYEVTALLKYRAEGWLPQRTG